MADQKELTGVLFRNDKKTESKHPDAKGSATIDGVKYWVSAWRNEKDGKQWTSLSFTRKETQSAPANETAGSVNADDLPF